MSFKPVSDSFHASILTVLQTQSPIEKILMAAFFNSKKFVIVPPDEKPEGEGLFVFPQRELGPYRADFIIKGVGYISGKKVYPPNKKVYIAVECDGAEFHSTDFAKQHDKKRDAYFLSKGIKTFRYTGSEIFQMADHIVKDLAVHLNGEIFRA